MISLTFPTRTHRDLDLPRICKVAAGNAHRWCSHIHRQVGRLVDNLRYDLCCTWPAADDSDALALQVIVVTPMCSVPGYSLEVVSARSRTPFGPIKCSNALTDHIGNPMLDETGRFLNDGDMPNHELFIPVTCFDKALKLCALLELILVCELSVVLLDLGSFGVEVGPVLNGWLAGATWKEQVPLTLVDIVRCGVDHSRYITRTAWIFVFLPYPAIAIQSVEHLDLI